MIRYPLCTSLKGKALKGGISLGSIYNTIINPIAWVFGKILDFLFMGLHAIGLGNIAIAIIVFTFLVKILMLPLTVKQSKMMN